jgi:hypothetical protein
MITSFHILVNSLFSIIQPLDTTHDLLAASLYKLQKNRSQFTDPVLRQINSMHILTYFPLYTLYKNEM